MTEPEWDGGRGASQLRENESKKFRFKTAKVQTLNALIMGSWDVQEAMESFISLIKYIHSNTLY